MTYQNEMSDVAGSEFSVGDLFRFMRRKLVWILAIPAIMAFAAVGFSFLRVALPLPATFYIELQSIKRGEYPNGARFSPGDLLSPDVVNAIRSKYGNSFSVEDFSRAVVVEYGSPLVRPLVQRYEALLSNKQLKPNEFEDISSKLSRDLESIAQRGVRIQVDPLPLSLGRDHAIQLALDIPLFWSKIYVEKYRIFLSQDVFDLDLSRLPVRLTSDDAFLQLNEYVSNMERGLLRLRDDPRLSQLTSAKGHTAYEIAFLLRDFDLRYVRSHLAKLSQGPFGEALQVYQRDAVLRLQEIESRIAGLDQTIESLPISKDAKGGLSVGPSGSLQLGNGGIEQLLKLGQQNALGPYLQSLLDKRIVLVNARAEQQFEVGRLQTVPSSTVPHLNEAEALEQFESISSEYKSLVSQAKAKLQRENRFLYTAVGAPTVESSSGFRFVLLMTFGAALLGFSLTIGVLLLKFANAYGVPSPRGDKRSE